jgi:predicted protein tyrosine phosphatase
MKILALSKNAFDKLMHEKGVNYSNVEQQDKLVFISLNNNLECAVESDQPYFPTNAKNLKVMFFADVDKDQYVPLIDGSKRKVLARAFTVDQAKELYGFIKDTVKEGKTEAVIIHCTMGVARSGAVASFIHDYLSGDWETFKRNNPQIQPNAHVYRLLHDQWYKDLEFPTQNTTNGDDIQDA